MTEKLLNELTELKLEIEKKIEPVRLKHAALFGGTFLTNLGKGDMLIGMVKRSITNSVLIPEKQLIVETVQLMRDIFKDVDNIVNLVSYNVEYFRKEIQLLSEEYATAKLNEARYEEYVKKLEQSIETLQKDKEYLLKLNEGAYGKSQ